MIKKKTLLSRLIHDLKAIWIEHEQKSNSNADDCTQIDNIIEQIETNLIKKPIQVEIKV